MDLGLRGKRCAVAAASAGLGLAVAQALAAEGAQVAICARTEDTLKGAAKTFGGIPLVADMSEPEEARRFVERAIAELGGVDILVTNAGGPPVGNFETSAFQNYEAALRTNLLSAVAMCQAAVPAMKAQKWGRVLAITSLSARRPRPRVLMTGMARAGLTAFLKALSLEVAADVSSCLHTTSKRTLRVTGSGINQDTKAILLGVNSLAHGGHRIATFQGQ